MKAITDKHPSIIAIDLAKDVFQVAHANAQGQCIRGERLSSRLQFSRAMAQWQGHTVVMESCATSHFWGRALQKLGFQVVLLPAQLVRPYRPRNKTDATDALALLEALRNDRIKHVPVKDENQQIMTSLHTLRELHKAQRVAHINSLRAHCREYGVILLRAVDKALQHAGEAIATLPHVLQQPLRDVLEQIHQLEHKMDAIEKQILALNRQNPAVMLLQSIPGVGPLTASALVASAVGPEHFKSGRDFAAWVGVTPREHSSGNKVWRGGISKKGDTYLRTLIIHGARSALNAALIRHADKPESLNRLQQWIIALYDRKCHNVAAVALANKMLRIAWRLWKDGICFDPKSSDNAVRLAAV